MTLVVHNASPTLAQLIRNAAKLDGAEVKTERTRKEQNYSDEYIKVLLAEKAEIDRQIEDGTIKTYKNMDEYEKAHGL